MKLNLRKLPTNFLKRNLIKQDEGRLSYVQLFGFLLITLGVIYLSSFLLPSGFIDYLPSLKLEDDPTPNGISIAFFTTMLGIAFAFPDMLKGQTKDISTMRIIVFMFANVMCMLLLKIGWNQPTLKEIGLDGYWMGVIAFLFGAKATQAYFENVKTFLPKSTAYSSDEKLRNPSKIAVAQIAKVQNEGKLHARFSNIQSVSETLKAGDSCLTIYIRDNNTNDIPAFVDAQLNETYKVRVQTEIVTNVGKGIPHIGQLTHDIVDSRTPTYFGSVCCSVDSILFPKFKGILTSGHIFTKGEYINYGGFVTSNQIRSALSNSNPIGKLYFQEINFVQDLAIVELDEDSNLTNDCQLFPKGFYECTTEDLDSDQPNVTILSKNNNKREAYIIDFNLTWQIYYGTNQKLVTNIILIGSHPDKNKSVTVSRGGDSGSCVYHTKTNKIIGMLLGGDDKFSFVLPFDETLKTNNFKLN